MNLLKEKNNMNIFINIKYNLIKIILDIKLNYFFLMIYFQFQMN